MATNEELVYCSAVGLIERFRRREISPVEVLQAQIARIEEYNGRVNAITYTHFDDALVAAKESERRYREGTARPLEGITVACKDEHGIAGWTVTSGSVSLKDNVVKKNHPLVNQLLDDGAVLHIQTTVPEMYFHTATWSLLWGVSRNPWNLACTPGGSSGGSGAALAAGFATLATGSDMGGSIRIPSSLGGLYGFKPPYARNADDPYGSDAQGSVCGPLARNFDDLVLFQNSLTARPQTSFLAVRPKLEYPGTYPGIEGWRIAYDPDFLGLTFDADYRRNTEAALKTLEDAGAAVDEVRLGWSFEEVLDAAVKSLLSSSVVGEMAPDPEDPSAWTSYALRYMELMRTKSGPRQLGEAIASTVDHYASLVEHVYGQGYRALVVPTLASTYVAADNDPTKDRFLIDGEPIGTSVHWVCTFPFNLLGRCPVVNVPTGVAGNGVPTGIQIVADVYEDLDAFQIASAYSQRAPRFFEGDLFPDFRSVAPEVELVS
ncbi:MAG: amidase [Thermomicrobiales bacterium]